MKTSVLLLSILVAGCAERGEAWTGAETVLPNQEAAVSAVWHSAYGRQDTPPTVLWHSDAPCGNGAWAHPGWQLDGGCVTGAFFQDWHIELEAAERVGKAPLAHELCHALKYIETGDSDPRHLSDCFTTDGRAQEAQLLIEDL